MEAANGASHDDFVIPYDVLYDRAGDDEDTEQHKSHLKESLHKRSIRHYRHATTKWGAALEGFGPLWFTVCISSGGLGLLLNAPFPYEARWLVTLASVLYVVDLVTFVVFMILMIARWIIYPHVAIRRAWSNPDELGAYAIPPIALLTLSSLTATQVSRADWGGFDWTLVAYVCWWIAVPWIFTTCIVVLSVLFFNGNQSDRVMSPVLFMAPVGLATAATEAGVISIYGHAITSRLAVPQLIVGYFAVGLALFTAVLLYTIFLHRLLAAGWPPAAKRAGLFILIGPCGQIPTALLVMGEAASDYKRFADYKPGAIDPPSSGTFWESKTASALDGAGILLALLVLGFAYLWLALAAVGVLEALLRRGRALSYSLLWWSLVFPTVTFTTAWLELASSLDSPAFRILTCIMTVFISGVYVVNLIFTAWGIVTGKLIFAKSELEVEQELMEKAKERSKEKHKEV